MRSTALEHPGQVPEDVDVALLGGTDDAEQRRPAVPALGAADEQRGVPQLGVPLELALGRVVVQRQLGVVDEPREVVEVAEVVLRDPPDRVGRRERSGDDVLEPGSEPVEDRSAVPSSPGDTVSAREAEQVGLVLEAVQFLEEGRALDGELGLDTLGVPQLAQRDPSTTHGGRGSLPA